MRFAEQIGCILDLEATYPLSKARFLEHLGAWTKAVNAETARIMNDPREGRLIK